LLRTLACRNVYPFAPRGEQTPRLALERIIGKAEHYIYIEEQFVWPCPLVDALARAVATNHKLKVIIVVARDLEFTGSLSVAHHEMRNEAIATITGRSRGQVLVYHLEQLGRTTPIYVHAKLMIVDDRFAAIGSVNVNRRSLSTDSELHLGIVDAQIDPGTLDGSPANVCRFAKALRVRLWTEHLGLDAKDVDDPVASVARWPDWSKSTPGAPSRVHHAVCYHPRTGVATLPEWAQVVRELRGAVPPAMQGVLDLDDILAALDGAEERLKRVTGMSVVGFVLGPRLTLLKRFLKDYVMNIETTC
jgi:phosphatidylserine/phosphatidylglycerophosphate/cardiolipin synthase-like enzyme